MGKAIAVFLVAWFLISCLGAWVGMIALGNAYHIGLIDVAPGFWNTFSVTIWAGSFLGLYAGSSARSK